MTEEKYDHKTVEAHWQKAWLDEKLNQTDISTAQKPFYNLMMFPYPSAEGLHVGNMYAFTGSDIYGRFKRMQGYDVFEPIGLDGFGIHSENFALKIGRHPMEHAKITEKNFYNQLHKIGAMFDWSRTVETYDPNYYRWTQWIFVQMFKHGLAYRGEANVNWCPKDKTVLADEQVIDGCCERCGNIVEKRLLKQWFFKITAYAEKLLENLPKLNWSEKVKVAQHNWIGKKEGIAIKFQILNVKTQIECFTTRPDTMFGATFIVLAPEHPFAVKLLRASPFNRVLSSELAELPEEIQHDIAAYIKDHARLSESERIAEGRKKTGVFTGLYAVNPLNNKKLPIYIADYVVMSVGTGAVVGVPGVDDRDLEFAKIFKLPVIDVIDDERGVMIQSDFLSGMDVGRAIGAMMKHLQEKGWGKKSVSYHLRDWIISRQRYWGPPIPMIYCEACAEAQRGQRNDMPGWWTVPEENLPVVLPRIEDYKPGDDGISPLAKHKEFYNVVCPLCGKPARRETDVSDTFLDSSWYFLRYPSTDDQTCPWNPERTRKWLPVYMYTGGAEHSVLHLLYSRFVTMAFHDWGLISHFEEPFVRFYAHGLVIKDGAKMSKSKGNVVNPDEYIETYGSDALRLYLMFIGPFDQGGDFRDTSMEGMFRWVGRIWRLGLHSMSSKHTQVSAQVRSELQKLIKKVSDDMEKRRYNTAIASMMEFTNMVSDAGGILSQKELSTFLKLLAPFAPHVTEELWFRLKNKESIHLQSWPTYNPDEITEELVQILVQVNGNLRDKLEVNTQQSKDQSAIEKLVLSRPNVQKFLGSTGARNIIFVPGRLINFVV